MAKISSSQPPPAPRTQRRSSTRGSMRAVQADKAGKAEAEAPESGGGVDGGPMTLADVQQKEQELREGLQLNDSHSPFEDSHSQREDKLRNEDAAKHSERARAQKDPSAKQDGKHGSGQQRAGNATQSGTPSKRMAALRVPQQSATGRRDGFESAFGTPATAVRAKNPITAPPMAGPPTGPMQPLRASGGAMHVLNNAKDPGVYFREEQHEGFRGDEEEDPELAAAVEECIRVLFGVRGIHHVGPGVNDANEPVILISVSRGFSQSSMAAIPDRVHRFKTLVALPYDLLPLKRDL